MINFDSQSSSTYQTISNLLRHIESLGFPKSDWCIYDAGQTLELTTKLYNRISETPEFKAFESIGGCHYLQDDNPFLPELDGISLATIATIFED
ncbi:MAG TPA: hypothetical protein V6C95_06480 [Coleofasciculaceae cyanobacterium]